jgi:hypothetical protein
MDAQTNICNIVIAAHILVSESANDLPNLYMPFMKAV